MPIMLIFLMGIANFAMHRAVFAADHPLFADAPWFGSRIGGRVARAIEFAVLVAALAFAYGESRWAVIAYGIYTAANALAAWLILSRRL